MVGLLALGRASPGGHDAHFERHTYHRHSHETYSFGITDAGARDVLADITGSPACLPLFADPVVSDPVLARGLRALHSALVTQAALRRDELLTSAVASLARRASTRPPVPAPGVPAGAIASLARQYIRERYAGEITASDLSTAVGRSRYAIHRAFRTVYGIAPSDYQRQLRLRAARRLIARGKPISQAAAETGFADQSHLTRWFTRYYGITPGAYERASPL